MGRKKKANDVIKCVDKVETFTSNEQKGGRLDSWYCRTVARCTLVEGHSSSKTCELCPLRSGTTKRTDSQGFAHTVCARYMPGAELSDKWNLILLNSVPRECFGRLCYVCDAKGEKDKAWEGASIECNHIYCKRYFHVTCGQDKGLLSDDLSYYCHFHTKGKPTSNNAVDDPSQDRETPSREGNSRDLRQPSPRDGYVIDVRGVRGSIERASPAPPSEVTLKARSAFVTSLKSPLEAKVNPATPSSSASASSTQSRPEGGSSDLEVVHTMIKVEPNNPETLIDQMKRHLLDESRLKAENEALKRESVSMNEKMRDLEAKFRRESDKVKAAEGEKVKEIIKLIKNAEEDMEGTKKENETLKARVVSMNEQIKLLEQRLRQELAKVKAAEAQKEETEREAKKAAKEAKRIKRDEDADKRIILEQIMEMTARFESKISRFVGFKTQVIEDTKAIRDQEKQEEEDDEDDIENEEEEAIELKKRQMKKRKESNSSPMMSKKRKQSSSDKLDEKEVKKESAPISTLATLKSLDDPNKRE